MPRCARLIRHALILSFAVLAVGALTSTAFAQYMFHSLFGSAEGTVDLPQFFVTLPTINNAGAVAFGARVFDPVDRRFEAVIFVDDGVALTLRANLTERVDAQSGGVHSAVINDPGAVGAFVSTDFRHLIVRVNPDGSITTLASASRLQPAAYLEFDNQVSMNNLGQLAVRAMNLDSTVSILRIGGGGITEIARSSSSLFNFGPPTINDSGVVAFRARSTEPPFSGPVTGSGGPLTLEATPQNCLLGGSFFPATINTSGLVFSDCGAPPLYTTHGDVVTTIVEGTEDPIFGTIHFNLGSMNNRGNVAFITQEIQPAGTSPPAGDVGIFTGNDQVGDKVVRSGDLVFGNPVDGRNRRDSLRLGAHWINDRCEITFLMSEAVLDPLVLFRSHVVRALPAGPNRAPTANAGSDQTVNAGDLVPLDGSRSRDPNCDPLSYKWEQQAGPAVSLNLSDPAHPTFVAPNVPRGGATVTLQRTVSDGELTSEPDEVNITIKNVNHAPVADAGADQTAGEDAPVTLNGSNSFDPDGDSLTFSWVQTGGPAVLLSDTTAAQPSFTSPLVGRAGEILTFTLTVSDGLKSATDSVNVVVEDKNHPPTANAGDDQTRDEGASVTLDGSGSGDVDDDALTYVWTQVAGPTVTLSDPSAPAPMFSAPLVGTGGATLVFRLTVNDGLVDSAPAEVTITVLDVNDPPACALAEPRPALLWPPTHKLIPVEIVGVADPNDDQVTITGTQVTQDEPVNGLGDGDTSPDAVIGGDRILLRAERSGTGNGRVYQVHFKAVDSQGGTCVGAVSVGVPHGMSKKEQVIDSGQRYDSTVP